MKNLFFFSVFFFFAICGFTQTPQAFKYQLIARDTSGIILSNNNLGVKISILQNTIDGTVVYCELHNANTNNYGLVNLDIGKGIVVFGNFDSIVWGNNLHFLKLEIDPAGGTNYFTMGITQFASVPYALHAKTVDNNMWTPNGINIFNNNSGFVGIGTQNPTSALHLSGSLRITDETEADKRILTSDAFGNASWQNPAIGLSIGDSNYIPKFISSNSISNSILYQNGNRIGIGTTNPSGRVMIQADATSPDNLPLFEIKDKDGKTVMVVYQDSVHFYVKDDISGTKANNKGSFAVSGKSTAKGLTNNFLLINADSTRIYTSDTLKGFGVQSLTGTSKTSYMQLTPKNYFIGHEAGKSITSGRYNSFLGYQAGKSDTSGSYNVFLGYQSGFKNANGYNNIFVGYQTGYENTEGYYNTANGYHSLFSNTSGFANAAFGMGALLANTTGEQNTACGYASLYNNTTGKFNTAIGDYAFFNGENYWNSTAIGFYSIITNDNQVRVGNTSVNSIGGQVGWTTLSDGRFKKNISSNVAGLDFILKLKPITYNIDIDKYSKFLNIPDSMRMKESEKIKSEILQTGFIAQDVEKAAQELGYDFSGVDKPKNSKDYYGLRYAEFTVPLVKAVQELSAKNEELQKNINDLQKRIESLEKIIITK